MTLSDSGTSVGEKRLNSSSVNFDIRRLLLSSELISETRLFLLLDEDLTANLLLGPSLTPGLGAGALSISAEILSYAVKLFSFVILIGGRRRAGVTAVGLGFSSKVFVTFPITANCAAAFFGDSNLINFYFFSNRR